MREVTQEAFYAALEADKRDIMPIIVTGPFPYTSIWKTRNGTTWGKSVGYIPEGKTLQEKRYYLVD